MCMCEKQETKDIKKKRLESSCGMKILQKWNTTYQTRIRFG